jgi:hypothetical protein
MTLRRGKHPRQEQQSKKARQVAEATVPGDGALALRLFDRLFPGPSWRAWRAWTCGVFAQPMSETEAATFRELTARSTLPTAPSTEAWTIAGRKSGKSRMAAFVVTVLAAVRKWKMAPGERPMVLLIAPSRKQAGIVLDYAEAMIRQVPTVRITRRTSEEVEVSTGVAIRIEAASFRTPRGFTVVGLVADEIAFWRTDSGANPDREILRAVRPALVAVPGSLLVAISTPYASRGVLHETYERHFGHDSDTLVVQAATTQLNPTIHPRRIEQAIESDPAGANAEWLAQFRSDLESLFVRAALAAVTVRGRFELPPTPGLPYVAFIDPAGGSGADSFTLAIAHRDITGRPILDLVREVRPTFSPEAVCQSFALELKRYGVSAVFSDYYAAQWPVERFAAHGIAVQQSPFKRSELYLELVPAVQSGACELLDNPRLINQLADLERVTGNSGKDAVDHPHAGHDDLANSACGALVMATHSVGLLAPLPPDFTGCNNFEASAASNCAFLSRGPWFPSDPHCKKHCPGLKAVLPVYRSYRAACAAAGEPVMTARQFLREKFEFTPMMNRFAKDPLNELLESLW